MRNLFIKFRKTEEGATLVEYGVALILAIIVGGVALTNLAQDTDAQMDRACNAFSTGGIAANDPNCLDN